MKVDGPLGKKREELGTEDVTVGDDDEKIGRERSHGLPRPAVEVIGLEKGETELEGDPLHG